MRETGARAYDEATGKGLVRHVMTRATTDGGLMAVLVVTGRDIPRADRLIARMREAVPGLLSLCLSINARRTNVILGEEIHTLWGAPVVQDTLHGLRFAVSPLSFFQVNPEQTEKLYRLALECAQLTGEETVVDAYCGAGTISLMLARHAGRVVGIEIVAPAVQDAEENARRNGIANATFIAGATEEVLPRLVADGLRPDVIVLDPPRKGCEEAVLRAILAARPDRVVYVSCGAPTLARDAKILCEGGYRAEAVQCVDMFCWTGAVETVMSFSKGTTPHRSVKVEFPLEGLNVSQLQGSATYEQIKAYVLEHSGLKVSTLYIAQIKQKYGIIERECYNKPKSEDAKQPQCPPDKEAAIVEALKFYGLIAP